MRRKAPPHNEPPFPPVWRNGRRGRLKICFTQVSGGSSPSTGTLFYPRRGGASAAAAETWCELYEKYFLNPSDCRSRSRVVPGDGRSFSFVWRLLPIRPNASRINLYQQ